MEKLAEKIDKIADDVSFMKGEQSQYLPSIKEMLRDHEERMQDQEKITENIRTKIGIAGATAGGLMAIIIAYLKSTFIK